MKKAKFGIRSSILFSDFKSNLFMLSDQNFIAIVVHIAVLIIVIFHVPKSSSTYM